MFRKLMWALPVLAAAALFHAAPAQATSARNPYGSFNLSGINYGSQQWSRSHSGRSSWSPRTGGSFFRRR